MPLPPLHPIPSTTAAGRSPGRWSALRMLLLAGAALLSGHAAQAVQTPPLTDRLVVRFRPGSEPDLRATALAAGASGARSAETVRRRLSDRLGQELSVVRQRGDGSVIYRSRTAMDADAARQAAHRLARDSGVLDVAPDVRVTGHGLLPDDPQATRQWDIASSGGAAAGAAGFVDAWPLSRGLGVVLAVIDTGSLAHPDLGATLLPGRDFVSDATTGGDGDSRDGDASDPGDWCASAGTTSSWHGLMTTGLLGATHGNQRGIAGLAPAVSLLPARAMGRCGGWLSDVADAILWTSGAGSSPANPTPARVINLSLGASAGTACHGYLQDAITRAIARGAVVVASAGNDASSTRLAAPANCSGVISVGAHTRSGDLAAYSNHTASLTLTAPGGGACAVQTGSDCDSSAIPTLGNSGTTTPGLPVDNRLYGGTSSAAPHVSAAVALMLAIDASLTPAQIQSTLQAHARPHPAGTLCARQAGLCGAGMLDAAAAVQAVALPQLSVTGAQAVVAGGERVTLQAEATGLGPFTWRWTQVSGPAVALEGRDGSTLSFIAPATRSRLGFQVEVTTAQRISHGAPVQVEVNNAPQLDDASASQTGQAAWSLRLQARDADADVLGYQLLSGPEGASVSGDLLQWTSPQPGHWTFEIVAVDSEGLASPTARVTLTVLAAGGDAPASTTSTGTGSSPADAGGSGGGGALSGTPLAALAAVVLAWAWLRRRPAR